MKHLLSINDLSRDEVDFLFELTRRVKASPDTYADALKGKTLGLIFEKPSTRTWVSFHAGMNELGGDTLYLGPQDIALGRRETVRDIARVLSSYLEGFVLRTFAHETVLEFAKFASRPVVNGLTDFSHPCQALTDLYTLIEKYGADRVGKLRVAYVGDGNNVLNSLLFLFAKMGLTLYYATPRKYAPKRDVLRVVQRLAKRSKARIVGSYHPREALRGAQVAYTDVWVSMGEEAAAREKKRHFQGFQLNQKMLRWCDREVSVMHCLPAHRGEEITHQVIEGRHSIIFQQASNRLLVQKAILLYLLTPMGAALKSAS